METIFSSETSVDIQRTTGCYIPEDRTIHHDYLKAKKLSV
jgi:hypothetical protein